MGQISQLNYIKTYHSKYYLVKSGVGQGSIIGPLLWSLYINDLSSALVNNYICYADNLVLFEVGEDVDQLIVALNIRLQYFSKWCNDDGLKINYQKSNFMVFHKQGDNNVSVTEEDLIDGVSIARVFSFKYLGVFWILI